MDPEANLKEQLELAEEILEMDEVTDTDDIFRLQDKANRLAELVQALDGWIEGGGFLPARWRRDEFGA